MFCNIDDNSHGLFFSIEVFLMASVKALNILIHVPATSVNCPRKFNDMILLQVSFRGHTFNFPFLKYSYFP